MGDRAAFNGILFVLFTGIPWEGLPREQLRQWQHAGMWEQLHLARLNRLREYDQIEGRRANINAVRVASPRERGNRPQPH